MRASARRDGAVAAACLLAALGFTENDNDERTARAYTGALAMLEAFADIRGLLRAWTSDGKR
jgi:hypothetical protein